MQPVAFIPSPSQGVWHLGPVPLRAYALMIILGIIVAVWLGERRWAARGGTPGTIIDVAVWAVPFGLVGGRLYHVVTDYQRYFGEGRDPVDALKIWEGGLGIWGAVLLGGVGAMIACRRRGISVAALGDAAAPGIVLAQGIGRWGNYWNQELYGRPLDTFWGLEIDQAHRPRLSDGSPDPQYADIATYHPTFLYEFLWCVVLAGVVIWADRRWKLTHGRTFALYLAGYTLGRFWIEWLRIDDAHHVLGLRLNNWTSLVVFLGAVAYIYWARTKAGRPEAVGAAPAEPEGPASETPAAAGQEPTEEESVTLTKPAESADDDPKEPAAEATAEEKAEEPDEKPADEEPEKPAAGEKPTEPEESEEPADGGESAAGEEPAESAESADEPAAEPTAEPSVESAAESTVEPADEAAGDGGDNEDDGEPAKGEPVKDPK
ncbi:prolipoprotein diacylglyceryl transferase [Spirillospora sp. NPDC029432]|uniref:prolipoprotein diacylglyceryl transferase n=1 Tax=Spirillospora sp. NPDC029432 TaxID=3154599 RepID=UPI003454FDB3